MILVQVESDELYTCHCEKVSPPITSCPVGVANVVLPSMNLLLSVAYLSLLTAGVPVFLSELLAAVAEGQAREP
jgi:hypothetical protein